MTQKNIIIRKLSDEELDNLSVQEEWEITDQYTNEVPYENTVQGLLEEQNIKFDDLEDWLLKMDVGRCNNAHRTDRQIYMNRPNSKWKDNIKIILNKDSDAPYVTMQFGNNEWIHEEAYDTTGIMIYTL